MLLKLLSTLTLTLFLVSQTTQAPPQGHKPWDDDHGHNQPYYPNPLHPVPGKRPLPIDEKFHYYEPHHNNDEHGKYKRSPCPAVNVLANRGFIPRSGKHVSYPELAQASRDVFNFGDDNVSRTILAAGQEVSECSHFHKLHRVLLRICVFNDSKLNHGDSWVRALGRN